MQRLGVLEAWIDNLIRWCQADEKTPYTNAHYQQTLFAHENCLLKRFKRFKLLASLNYTHTSDPY